MPRTSRPAFTAPSRRGRRVAIVVAGALVALIALAAVAAAAEGRKDDRDARRHLRARPIRPARTCPARRSAASPASRSPTARPRTRSWSRPTGTIKSWTLTLAQPTNSQRSFFNGFFGTPPEARLAILRRVPGTNPPRYNLRRQGAVKVLTPYLGQTVKFGASLKVEKGDIIGITVPTWAPIFSQELSATNVWRASREPGRLHQLDRHPPGPAAGNGRQTRHLRLQVRDGAPALHGDPGRGRLTRGVRTYRRMAGITANAPAPERRRARR